MKYLDYPIDDLISCGGFNTAKEICSQPELWKKTYLKLLEEKEQIVALLEKVLKNEQNQKVSFPYIHQTDLPDSKWTQPIG